MYWLDADLRVPRIVSGGRIVRSEPPDLQTMVVGHAVDRDNGTQRRGIHPGSQRIDVGLRMEQISLADIDVTREIGVR